MRLDRSGALSSQSDRRSCLSGPEYAHLRGPEDIEEILLRARAIGEPWGPDGPRESKSVVRSNVLALRHKEPATKREADEGERDPRAPPVSDQCNVWSFVARSRHKAR